MDLKKNIIDLNCEIRSHFSYKKKFAVRKGILPWNSWKAVKIAKNVGHSTIPNITTIGNVKVASHEESNHFACLFDKKVSDVVSSTSVNPDVYNGRLK